MSSLLSYQDSTQHPVQVIISFDTERWDQVPVEPALWSGGFGSSEVHSHAKRLHGIDAVRGCTGRSCPRNLDRLQKMFFIFPHCLMKCQVSEAFWDASTPTNRRFPLYTDATQRNLSTSDLDQYPRLLSLHSARYRRQLFSTSADELAGSICRRECRLAG
jgi:hypothetical protein